MNELTPHRDWAHRVVVHASVLGVKNKGVTFVDLMTAAAHNVPDHHTLTAARNHP